MDGDKKPKRRLELRRALQELKNRDGIQREDLLEALQGELRELQERWNVDIDSSLESAQKTIALNLSAHISKLTPRPANQQLSVQNRRQQYEHAIRVCFNALVYSDLKGMDLTQRQAWLAEAARGQLKIDESTCRRDLRDALDQIEQQMLASGYQPVRLDQATDDTTTAVEEDHAEEQKSTPEASTLPALPEPVAVAPLELGPAPSGPRRPRRIKRRNVIVAALLVLALGGLGSLGALLAHGNKHVTDAGRAMLPDLYRLRLSAPLAVSKAGVSHRQDGTYTSLRMSSGVVLNLGVVNTTTNAPKWGLTANAEYKQDIETVLLFENEGSIKRNIGVTVKLLYPFSHKGNIWTITWRVTTAGHAADISVSVNVGRSDAQPQYRPDSSVLEEPDSGVRYRPFVVSDTQLFDPSQPLQTLDPSTVGATAITSHFLVEKPSFSIAANAKNANGNWLSNLYASPGDTLPVAITVENNGLIPEYGTAVEFDLPQEFSYIPGSTSIGTNATEPGKAAPDSFHKSEDYLEIITGTLQPGQTVVVRFKIRIEKNLSVGTPLTGYANISATNVIDDLMSVLTITVQ